MLDIVTTGELADKCLVERNKVPPFFSSLLGVSVVGHYRECIGPDVVLSGKARIERDVIDAICR